MRLRASTGALSLLGAACVLGGCTATAPTTSVTPAPPPVVRERHWGYASSPETAGPAEWGSLPGNTACATGTRQSPVALGTKAPFPVEARDLPNLVFKYGKTGLHLVNDGRSILANVDKGSAVEVDGGTWTLVELHFHSPSEHSLDGLHYPMEMHLVHAGPDGRPGLVVGVFLVQGGDNPGLAPVFASLPKDKGGKKDDAAATVDLASLLPPDRTAITYEGSLTTPPCTEGIRWYVLSAPIGITGEQLGAFVSATRMNATNRPLQPLGARKVSLDSNP